MTASLFDLRKIPLVGNPNDEWYTPLWIIQRARLAFQGDIDLDPASCEMANRTVQAKRYIAYPNNGLDAEWAGNVWINPPFSDSKTAHFVDKVLESDCRWIMLCLAQASSKWWFKMWEAAESLVVLPKKGKFAVRFQRPNGEFQDIYFLIALFSNLTREEMDLGFGDIARAR